MTKIRTEYWPKPIPLRQFDWTAVTDDYEPGHPIGYGRTEQEAIADLRDLAEIPIDDSFETLGIIAVGLLVAIISIISVSIALLMGATL